MVTKTNEQALEEHIESWLIDNEGYKLSKPADFNREFCIDEVHFWNFLESTQKEELDKLRDRPNYQRLILERLTRRIKKDTIAGVLKKGLAIDNANFSLLYRLPYNDLNPDVIKRFDANIFSIARQIHYSESEPLLSVDMVLFVNGMALATFELKNPWTGQNVYHAREQYKNDRDPKEPLFQFGKCLVHFALDPNEVFMATKIAGKATYFLPFNKGFNNGKGNPPNANGMKASYLWQEILAKKSLTNILEHFAKYTKDEKGQRVLFFPRYHQLDVVRKIMVHSKEHGTGQTYLIQHSAGSGKSNSITWLSYQLIEQYDQSGTKNIFDSVIVVTDRRILDKQIRNNIKLFSEVKNIVAHAESAADLKKYLEDGKKLIITTIQKFPFIVDGMADLSNRNFAVIIDEAHSSQSGKAADKLNMSLGDDNPEIADWQDKILATMEGRKMLGNSSYFAFTATPKNATLEKFGWQATDGSFHPFHLYSMKQAIEEGFILDVLAKYTTYKSYYSIQKSIEDNPLFDTAKAQKKLRAYVEGHKETIKVKARIMVDHFIANIYQRKKMKGKAKAMVVTRNIECALRYFFAIREELTAANVPFKALVAFSGTKSLDGVEHTEDSINGFASKDIASQFASDDYKILVVANKFLTGFDEPQLHTMYVDKRLQGVLAVQALSRLNRCNVKLNKDDTFILDFTNPSDEIKRAFDPFYTATSLSEPTDANILHDIKGELDKTGYYEQAEVEEFNKGYFNNVSVDDLHPILDQAAARFDEEEDEEAKIDFKIKAKQFVKIYAQIACLINFNQAEWEMLHWFLKFLIPKLAIKDPDKDTLDKLLESVDLSTYGLERVKLEHQIVLNDEDSELDPQNPNPRGHHGRDSDRDPLDEIIANFNEKYFSDWDATPEEQRVKFLNIARHVATNANYKAQVVNNPDQQNRQLALEKLIKQAVGIERKREVGLYKQYASDNDFKRAFDASIMRLLSQSGDNKIGQALGV